MFIKSVYKYHTHPHIHITQLTCETHRHKTKEKYFDKIFKGIKQCPS